MRACLGPKLLSWAKVNKSVCPGSFHKAPRILHKSGQRQPEQMRTSGSRATLPTATPPSSQTAPNTQAVSGECQPHEDVLNASERYRPVTANSRVPFEHLLKT